MINIDDPRSTSQIFSTQQDDNIDQQKYMTLQYPIKSALAEVNNKQNFFTKSNHQIPVRSNTGLSQQSIHSKSTQQKNNGYIGTLKRLLSSDEDRQEMDRTRRISEDQ